jgi:XTP/dITP diphosphohydrolase
MISRVSEKPRLLMATRNKGKILELQKNLEKLDIELLSLEDIKDIPVLEEKGTTFLENAVSKARTAGKASGLITLADDSGLAVDALDGKPGVYSARFAGEHADDQENNMKLLQMMKGISYENRTARFICVIAVALPDGKLFSVEGKCEGIILEEMRGSDGFGYDPLFYIPDMGKTFAELTLKEKNHISHRGVALKKTVHKLERFLFV